MNSLDPQALEALRSLSTPTVSNAIEIFNVRPRNTGFMSPEIRSLTPELGVMVGYAVTGLFAARSQPTQPASRYGFWKLLMTVPAPRILVLQDLDDPPGIGAYVGEVQSTIHKRLDCVGTITNGCVRDLDEVRALKFHCFARGPCVSHAYVHLIEFGGTVEIGGLAVRSGDLLHADQHGVVAVPLEVAARVPQAAAQVAEREQRIIKYCGAPDFTLEGLKQVYDA